MSKLFSHIYIYIQILLKKKEKEKKRAGDIRGNIKDPLSFLLQQHIHMHSKLQMKNQN